MSGLLKTFDPDSADEETRRLSRLAQKCWAPLTIVYDPLKNGSIDSTDTVPHDRALIRAQNADYVPSKNLNGRPECTIFVGGLSRQTTADTLKEEFGRYGRIVKATVVEDIITGRSRGYGFVEYAHEGEATRAYERGEKKWLDGSKIIVDMECSRLLPGWVPRRLGGGFNGRKESGQLRFGCRERPFRKPIKLLTETEILKVYEKTMGRKIGRSGQDEEVPGDKEVATASTTPPREMREPEKAEADVSKDVEIGEKKEKKKRREEEGQKEKKKEKKRRRSREDQRDRKKRKKEHREKISRD